MYSCAKPFSVGNCSLGVASGSLQLSTINYFVATSLHNAFKHYIQHQSHEAVIITIIYHNSISRKMAQARTYRPHQNSNPFANFPHQSIPQASHVQHPGANLQHNLGGHPGFGAGPNGGVNIFGPQTGNAGLQGAFSAGAGLGNGGAGLASQAAQMGFAHGAALQQQHGHEAANANAFSSKSNNSRIREVWKHNVKQEFAVLRQLVEKYPYISMVITATVGTLNLC
jgi:hypothetical protein